MTSRIAAAWKPQATLAKIHQGQHLVIAAHAARAPKLSPRSALGLMVCRQGGLFGDYSGIGPAHIARAAPLTRLPPYQRAFIQHAGRH